MKQHLTLARIVLVLAFIVTIIGFSAFSQQQNGNSDSFRKDQDTTTSGKRNRTKDAGNFDKLELSMKQLDSEMKKLDIEMEQLHSKINLQQLKAAREVDFEEINRKVEESIRKIDWDKMNEEIKVSEANLAKIDMNKVKEEMQKAKAEINHHKMEHQMDKFKIDKEKIKIDVEKAMKEAKISMLKAKEEIKNLQDFTNALQKDGLIDKSKGYKIEVKEGELFIDGKKQPKEINDKFRKYFKKNNFTLDMSEGDSFRI